MGPGKHDAVSRLSPYIRTRLITEEEATRAVLREHSPRAAEKFLQEVAWRTYWKGWLEMRPEVWTDYRAGLSRIEKSTDYRKAVAAKTGIDCFDHWVRELVETGYLHNHARMWFASIWIFTLELPWYLGAEFFLKYLLDGDPAANTLSWRWVAGLHTKGKHYLARASNIEKFTGGRFNPAGKLNETASAIGEDRIFERKELSLPANVAPRGRTGHLMFPEDLAEAPGGVGEIVATAAYLPPVQRTTSRVTEFLEGAINDTLNRSQGTLLDGPFQSALIDWMSSEKLDSVVISRPTVGPTRDFLDEQGLPENCVSFVRAWDRLLWPLATAGFFKLKKELPEIHSSLAPRRQNDLFPDI